MVAETVIIHDVEQVFEGVTSDLTSEFFKCRGSDSNRHGSFPPQDFKSCASTHSATPAAIIIITYEGSPHVIKVVVLDL